MCKEFTPKGKDNSLSNSSHSSQESNLTETFAEKQFREYKESFADYCDYKLVNRFNLDTCHNGWASQRAYFISALLSEFEDRNINLDEIVEDRYENGLWRSASFAFPVALRIEDGEKKVYQKKPIHNKATVISLRNGDSKRP